MDETKPPADGAKGEPEEANSDNPAPESPACPPADPASAEAPPDDADDDWVSL